MRPTQQCQRFRRRSEWKNWNAHSRLKMVTPTMWITTGIGESKKRAFCAVSTAPLASSDTRASNRHL